MTPAYLVSFVDHVAVRSGAAGPSLAFASGSVSLERCSPTLVEALASLSARPATEGELLERVVAAEGRSGGARLLYYLGKFDEMSLLRRTVESEGAALATLVPFSPRPTGAGIDPATPGVAYRLSRFAWVRLVGSELILESPLAHSRIVLHDVRALGVLNAFRTPRTREEAAEANPGLAPATVGLLMGMLLRCGGLSAAPELPGVGEPEPLRTWEFHDLLFHTRSRMGRHRNGFGATHRFLGQSDPLPAVKPPGPGPFRSFSAPDITAVAGSDPPFTAVLEGRRSVRTHGSPAISVDELGELLFRAARVRATRPPGSVPYEHGSRPYPGGGACYELEIYPVVRECEGLDPGMYHYCPSRHGLEPIAASSATIEALLDHADWAAAQHGRPQILLVVTARFARITWAYEGMAYAAVLKHVGALFQTLYLVAEAMDLAACALGGGDADLFAEASGTDYLVESSVGEFMVGRR